MRLNHNARFDVSLRPEDAVAPARPGYRASSLDRQLRRWLIVALLPVVVASLGLYEFTLRRQARSAQNSAAAILVQTLGAQWRSNDRMTAEKICRVCQNLALDPGILAAAVFNSQREPLAQTSRHDDLLPLLHRDQQTASSIAVPRSFPPPEGLAAEFPLIQRVDVDLGPQFDPLRPARVVLLLGAVDSLGPGPWRWWFYGIVGTSAAGGFLLANWTLRRRLVRPIGTLLRSSATRRVESETVDSSEPTGELGELARWVHELKEEAFHWRAQAERVERRMALQVASQTREISRDLRKFQREAWLDPLTRVKNRRFLDEQLPVIFAAHRDADLDLSLVMLDLDHFKRLNDERGHQAGDEVLTFLGELLRQCLRADDIPVRFGGDEFVIILPGVCAEDAVGLTKRVLALFSQRVKVMFDGRTIPGITAGIAAMVNNRPATPAGLLAAADRALYQAKKSGRGTIQICRPLERKSA